VKASVLASVVVVVVVAGRADDQGSIPGGRLGIFLFDTASRPILGPTQPHIQWVPGALLLGVKRPGRELTTDLHLVPRSKNAWSYTSTPPTPLHGAVLI
jgi:hypothetical protein